MIERSPGEGEDGFTLVEVLVAFAIVAICLGTLYAAMGDHARQTAMSDMHRQTLALARTHLETFGEAAAGQANPMAGDYPNGTIWRLSKRAIALGEGTTDAPIRPFLVVLQVYDRSGHRIVALNSIKMLPVER
jgi:general secretion pathway protein I